MQEKDRCRSYRILCIITGCGGGDWPPLLALAEGLQRSGHDLMVVCDKSTVEAVQACGLTTLCLPLVLDLVNIFEPAISRLLSGEDKCLPGGENPLKIWGVSCVDFIRTSLKDWRPSLVITSLLGTGFGAVWSKSLSTPWCFLNPSFYFGHSCGHLRDTDFSAAGGRMYGNWLLPLTEAANLVLHATDQIFDICPAVLPSQHKYVGPIFKEEPGNEEELLQRSGPRWVLIAVSTSPQPDDLTIVSTAIRALGSMDFRVLVTLAPGHNHEDLGRIPDNVYVRGYIPHSKVLPHCRLVISHAGHGIVMKSMAHGIPMVLVPWGRDQPGVAARAERLGTAVVVPRAECRVSTIAEAIRKIVADPVYLDSSQRVSCRLRNMDGVAKAVNYIQRFLKNDTPFHTDQLRENN